MGCRVQLGSRCMWLLCAFSAFKGQALCYMRCVHMDAATRLAAGVDLCSWNHRLGTMVFDLTQQPCCCCCCCRLMSPLPPQTATNETDATRFGPATNCDSPCLNPTLDPPGSCGGGLANSLYRLPPPPEGGVSPPPPPPAGGGGGPAPPAVIPIPTTTLNVTALGELI
jgi:hypothetical protein